VKDQSLFSGFWPITIEYDKELGKFVRMMIEAELFRTAFNLEFLWKISALKILIDR